MKTGLKIEKVRPEFVECIPDQLDEGVLYVSERFRVCSHKCCCGCGEEVVTPLSSAEWKLTRERNLVSLWPSVGNWDYACRSHYVIRRNRVIEALPMTERQIARVHEEDAADLARITLRGKECGERTVHGRRPRRFAQCRWCPVLRGFIPTESRAPKTREDCVRFGADCSGAEHSAALRRDLAALQP